MPRGIQNIPSLPQDEDAKPFATYRNYMDAFLWIVGDLYGRDLSGLRAPITQHEKFPRLMRAGPDMKEIRRHLRSAWSTELAMSTFGRIPLGEAVRYANVWAPVQAYYAVYSSLLAWLRASGDTSRSHKAVLNSLGQQMLTRGWLSVPWSVVCIGCPPTDSHQFVRLNSVADAGISNLAVPRDDASAWGLLAKCLSTTREHIVEDALEAWKRDRKNYREGKPRKALRRAEKESIAAKVAPTSVFDFFYRMRIRTNYRDTDAFALGAWTEREAGEFYGKVVSLTSCTLRFVEILVSGRIGRAKLNLILDEFASDSRMPTGDIQASQYWGRERRA